MATYISTIQVLIEADSDAEACDALAEAMRPLVKAYAPNPAETSILDWRYDADASGQILWPVQHDGSGFEFTGEE